MESAKEYLSGFRIPDLKKLWYGSSDAPDGPPPKPLIVQFEAYLVKLQELSLWTDPKSSGLALLVIHAIYWYLSVTSNSTVYLLAMLAMLTFVYTTWTQRIWPEIRVPEANPGPEPEWTPVSPDVLSAPELVRLCDEVKVKCYQAFEWLKQTRENEHGKFCAIVSTFFLVLAYVGSRLTTLGLFYYVSVGYLTVPGILKILVKYPAVHCMLETMEEFRKEQSAPKVEVEPVVKQEETKAASLAESVYATLQTGFNAVSNLNLKSEAAKHDEDLKSYLPEEDEANQSILESAINSSIKDPMQAHKLDQEEVPIENYFVIFSIILFLRFFFILFAAKLLFSSSCFLGFSMQQIGIFCFAFLCLSFFVAVCDFSFLLCMQSVYVNVDFFCLKANLTFLGRRFKLRICITPSRMWRFDA